MCFFLETNLYIFYKHLHKYTLRDRLDNLIIFQSSKKRRSAFKLKHFFFGILATLDAQMQWLGSLTHRIHVLHIYLHLP